MVRQDYTNPADILRSQVVVCKKCGANVELNHRITHTAFHKKLDELFKFLGGFEPVESPEPLF